MSGRMPPPFVCYHPRERWVAEGSGSYSTGHSEYTLTGYHCGVCGQWIPPDSMPWPTDEEAAAAAERARIRAAVEGLVGPGPRGREKAHPEGWYEACAAVLAIIEGADHA